MKVLQHQACLLLGSNIRPEEDLSRAVELLRQSVTIRKVSSIWESVSEGSQGPDFLNLALLVRTSFGADAFIEKLIHPLEKQLGRVRSADKNAPRPIDIDIILFDNNLIDQNLWRFAYRAVPVAELLPDYRSGKGESLGNAAARLAKITPIRLRKNLVIDTQIDTP